LTNKTYVQLHWGVIGGVACIWANLPFLEADFATGHGVAQLGLVVDEGHDAQVGLDEQGLLQDQHPVGSPRDGMLLVGLLHRLDELGPEVVQLTLKKQKKRRILLRNVFFYVNN